MMKMLRKEKNCRKNRKDSGEIGNFKGMLQIKPMLQQPNVYSILTQPFEHMTSAPAWIMW